MKINPIELWTIISILGVGGMIIAVNANKDKNDKKDKEEKDDDIVRNSSYYDPNEKDFISFQQKYLDMSYEKAIKTSEEAFLAAEKAYVAAQNAYERSIAIEEMDEAQKKINKSKELRVHSGGRANKKTKKMKSNINNIYLN